MANKYACNYTWAHAWAVHLVQIGGGLLFEVAILCIRHLNTTLALKAKCVISSVKHLVLV